MHNSSHNNISDKEVQKVVIIGGGPAGLTAAYELAKADVHSIVLEKDGDVGGISRTVHHKGYGFDIGGHRFYTKVRAVEDFWNEILPAQDFRLCSRLSRIYYDKKFFLYPIQVWDTLRKLGFFNSSLILLSYLQAKVLPYRKVTNFEQNVCNRFGKRLYQTFFKSYTEKVWGIPCNQITAEWADQRIRGLGLGSAVWKALLQTVSKRQQSKAKQIKTLINEFHYPRLGPGMMWRQVARRVQEAGSEVRLHSSVERIRWSQGRVQAVDYSDGMSTQSVTGSHFISSMPIRELIQKLDPPAPSTVQDAAQALNYRDFLTVALILKQREVFRDNWIYIHDPAVRMGRIQNFKNWSTDMVADEEKTCLGLEYFCFEGDGLWSMSDEELIELGKKELETLGIAEASIVEDGAVIRQAKAYPVYDGDYEASLKTVRDFLSSWSNLQLVGRNGMHRYNNQDHSMLTAMLAAKNILGANYDLWKVNAEQEYHEESSSSSSGDELLLRDDVRKINATQPRVPRRHTNVAP